MTDDKTENIARPIVKGLFGIYPIESVKIFYNAIFSIGTVHIYKSQTNLSGVGLV